jgi:amicyanin
MSKTIIAIVVVAILVLGLGAIFLFQGQSTDTGNLPDNTEQETQSPPATETPSQEEPSQPQTHTIDIMDFAFSPKTLTINEGDTVIWTNKDSIQHTVTSDSGNELDSPYISRDNTYTHTFTTAGTFDYHCRPHPYMKGTIVVE